MKFIDVFKTYASRISLGLLCSGTAEADVG